MRQWILLNRRVKYDPQLAGYHELWISVGGSAGHSGLWGVNIDEGSPQDLGGRRWNVEVVSPIEAQARQRRASQELAADQKALQHADEIERRCQLAVSYLVGHPEGETKTMIRDQGGVGNKYIDQVVACLLTEQTIVACQVKKNTRQEAGFKLVGCGRARPPKRA
jgi:hypothetical protein